jgi:hypothetical protein
VFITFGKLLPLATRRHVLFRVPALLTFALCLIATAVAQTKEVVIPAGTVLRCTLDEPNFSSRTAQSEDPVLCSASPLYQFGHSVFPHGAYLAGRLENYRDPGRFFGKGWLKLEFDRLVLPNTVVPLSSRVISASHLKVNREGKILGGGHAKRDAVEWLIPPLWPVKVLTLPARGPRPELKSEARITLKLLDDVIVASGELRGQGRHPTESQSVGSYQVETMQPTSLGSLRHVLLSLKSPQYLSSLTLGEAVSRPPVENAEAGGPVLQVFREPRLTLLFLKSGIGYVAADYWVEGGVLHYQGAQGSERLLPLGELDLNMTVRLNQERGSSFVLRSQPGNP